MNARKERLAILQVTACLFALGGMGGQTLPTAIEQASNPNPELVGKLTKELKITPKQAMGGAGAIFAFAKNRLNPADFSKVAAAVPGMDGLLRAAPAATGESALDSLGSALGSLESIVPGGTQGLASLASAFKSLGLSPTMISKFAPVLQNYIGSKGGSSTAALLAGVFNRDSSAAAVPQQ